MLKNKTAIIYGAGGSLGSSVALAFAAAGAKVFLTGRSIDAISKVAEAIRSKGGEAETDLVDASDEHAVTTHLQKVSETAGSVDISFNLTGTDFVQSIPLVDMTVDEYVKPLAITMQTQFITTTAAGKIMMKQGSGVILSLTATPGGIGYPYTGGFAATCCAIESLSRNLASELGAYGIRVVNIRSGGSPDSSVFKTAIDSNSAEMEPILGKMKADTMLKTLPPMSDIANVAVFLASAMSASITGVTVDVTAGTTAALNYRVNTSARTPSTRRPT